MATAAFLLAPAGPIPQRNDKNQKREYYNWEKKLSDLIHYRSGYRELNRLKRGGAVAYLSNRGKADEFNFGEFSSDETQSLLNLARAYTGEYLAVWTYGHAVCVMLMRSAAEGQTEVREVSFRLTPHATLKRDAKLFDDFCGWFQGSAFSPDVKLLRAQVEAPQISVSQWFKAFGIDGASDLKNANAAGLWEDFERAAMALLRGETIPTGLVKKLNEQISQKDEDSRLKTRPPKQPGAMARLIADAECDLAEVIGKPETLLWKERYRAADFYWDITDCEDALSRLTVGLDKKGLGVSASFGRLLCHYPVALRRDNIFLALAGLQAEAANGHAFVQSFGCFAQSAHNAGFTLAIYPASKQAEFRRQFGIESDHKVRADDSNRAAEVFLDIHGIVKADPLTELEKWFAKTKAEGLILRAESDGNHRVLSFTHRIKVRDPKKLAAAARSLDMAGMFAALGLPDLLKPGDWQEGAYCGANRKADQSQERKKAVAALSKLPAPERVNSFKEILRDFPRSVHHVKDQHNAGSDAPLSMKITLPNMDDAFARVLHNDLNGTGLVEDAGEIWLADNEICLLSYSSLRTPVFLRVLGDLPTQTRLAIDSGDKKKFHYELRPDEKPSRFAACWITEEGKEKPKKSALTY